MAKKGIIPHHLFKAQIPKCAGCIFGKTTRIPWRIKGQQGQLLKHMNYPGQCVSVDQVICTLPGFIVQMKGKLTHDHYRVVTVFVDQYSKLRFVHLNRSASSIETVHAKLAFEQYAKSFGVKMHHYHTDNG